MTITTLSQHLTIHIVINQCPIPLKHVTKPNTIFCPQILESKPWYTSNKCYI